MMSPTMFANDLDLIRACQQGEPHAWDDVLEKYERLVFSIALNYGLTTDDAADVAQITFTILLQSLDRLRPDTRLGAWLSTVARRHTWRWLAHHRREAVDAKMDVAENEALGGVTSQTEHWEQLEWLNHGLNLLDERCRALLTALYFDPEQQPYAEVAKRLGMAVGSIGPTRARCLEQMKRHLGDGAVVATPSTSL